MWNPLSWVMEAAAIMAIVLANGGVRTRAAALFFKKKLGKSSADAFKKGSKRFKDCAALTLAVPQRLGVERAGLVIIRVQ
jgi:hypothetical protein